MTVFHRTVARPLVLKCAALFLQRFDPSLQPGSLPGTEQAHLLRGLYRFQLYCNLFGKSPKPGGYYVVGRLSAADILALFFVSFSPWEVEEIDCIYTMIWNKYNVVLDVVRYNLAKKSDRQLLRQGIVLNGLTLFSEVLEIYDHKVLVNTMEQYLVKSGALERVLS
ncbi:hypothetical protein MYCTH_2108373 [Thermothelomyces thermophilus ATCC 42464]|uniref:Uncharacterized protein n=1 Tax=Thermothelomyces thermophilus (strain ATCC 42464 / BCRC 31852 / DSM 1799) TaxID=573729 RepID=G2Q9X9_THET4|nr:uncharacterized protein MYCTH_2108373 [Thermothelomyces thermophilus ATCC 42464]AEO55780.1 hypothetical protein MYCTH_2108373 [Thermothelomyces thermophilus ATCC 42464]